MLIAIVILFKLHCAFVEMMLSAQMDTYLDCEALNRITQTLMTTRMNVAADSVPLLQGMFIKSIPGLVFLDFGFNQN